MSETPGELDTQLSAEVNKLKISDDPRGTLRRWLGNILKIAITDGRIIVGSFVCTDRDANVILENALEYSQSVDDDTEPRVLGLALIPGRHVISVALMTH